MLSKIRKVEQVLQTATQVIEGIEENNSPQADVFSPHIDIGPYVGPYDGEAWAHWLLNLFPSYFLDTSGRMIPFADFHAEFWRNIYDITPDVRPDPRLYIWSREFGKSTNAELGVVNIGAREVRPYVLYVSGTQDQADDHVLNISALLEQPKLAQKYPRLGQRLLSKYGYSRGWRINRLRTASGFTVDAVGLDKAMRGARIEEWRPGLIIFDDVDDDRDTPRTVEKKIRAITRKIIPAGASNVAVIFVQNLVHAGSIASRLVNGEADFLHRRKVSGPHPAIQSLAYKKEGRRVHITGGIPTWAGMSLSRFQTIVDDVGFPAAMVEYQHETEHGYEMFLSDVWHSSINVIPPVEIPLSWPVDRSFDWGLARPYAVGWWAESDGETPIEWTDGKLRTFPKGTLFLIHELYGCTGKANEGVRHSAREIANRIQEVEKNMYWGDRVKKGPADTSIFNAEDDETDSIAQRMKMAGVEWEEANKRPGSRVAGAAKIVEMLEETTTFPMEGPGLYIFDSCPGTIRTLPALPTDPRNKDDVDTDAEDHCWDMMRYRVLHKRSTFSVATPVGH